MCLPARGVLVEESHWFSRRAHKSSSVAFADFRDASSLADGRVGRRSSDADMPHRVKVSTRLEVLI